MPPLRGSLVAPPLLPPRCRPDVHAFTLLMAAHVRAGQWREAMALFDDMTAKHGVGGTEGKDG